MAPNTYYYCYSNYCRSSMMASHIISLMSFKSPSIMVIGFMDILLALDFFHGPTFSCPLGCLIWNRGVYSSAPPCFVRLSSSSSSSGEGDFSFSKPCLPPPVCPPVSYVAMPFSLALSSAYFLLFSANCSIFNLATSFF